MANAAAAKIEFPFERGRPYLLGILRAFETELLIARQRDQQLSGLLRNPRGAPEWIMLRNKELVPIKLFAGHIGASDDDQFVLKPAGDPVDAQIIVSGRTTNLQLTLTSPVWGAREGAQANSGYQHHQIMVALNENEFVLGYPP